MKAPLSAAERCTSNVWSDWSRRDARCTRRGTVERDGRLYCGQHDPEAAKAKRLARDSRWKLERKAADADDLIVDTARDVVASVLASKESTLPAAVAESRRVLLDAIDVAKNARAALEVT